MSDLEMLRLAAKAISLEVMCWDAERNAFRLHKRSGGGRWNPLTDDGDALRLAVGLNMGIQSNDQNHWQLPNHTVALYAPHYRVVQAHEGDAGAATRRAIVRAAAYIGRSKCEE